jgi:hypothetical protein
MWNFTRPAQRILALGLVVVGLSAPRAQAESSMREFMMSCTYGVLAGTLVGAAMLAFTDQPGENLNKVARGASLGLYTGILLGFYVVYGVSSEEEDPSLMNGPSEGWRQPEARQLWAVVPTWSNGQADGAALFGEVLRF